MSHLPADTVRRDIHDLVIAILAVVSMTPVFYAITEALMQWLDLPL